MTLISPETPAAASRWPMFVFTDPIDQWLIAIAEHRAKGFDFQRITELRPGSMRLDVTRLRAAQRPAKASAARMTASCAGPLGAVRLLLGPSWLTALPRIKARMRSPSACAWLKRLRTTTPHPSLRANPSAVASNVLHRPSGASMRECDSATNRSGARIRLTPPASAMLQSPFRSP